MYQNNLDGFVAFEELIRRYRGCEWKPVGHDDGRVDPACPDQGHDLLAVADRIAYCEAQRQLVRECLWHRQRALWPTRRANYHDSRMLARGVDRAVERGTGAHRLDYGPGSVRAGRSLERHGKLGRRCRVEAHGPSGGLTPLVRVGEDHMCRTAESQAQSG